MTPTPYYEKRLFARTLEDEANFSAITERLPVREDLTPYHSGPHSLRSMRTAYKMCGHPRSILEVGFCLGHSACIWFWLGAKRVISIENSTRQQTVDAARTVKADHGERFSMLATTSKAILDGKEWPFGTPDMMFIDGGHEFDDVSSDIALGLKLNVEYFLFDDWFPKWGPGTQPAVEHHKLIPVAIIGNMALCVPDTGWKNP